MADSEGRLIFDIERKNEEGCLHQINLFPLPPFGPLDTVHKIKCSDEIFSLIQVSLERGFVDKTAELCLNKPALNDLVQ